MDPLQEFERWATRRQFFARSAVGIGTAALAGLLNERARAATSEPTAAGAGHRPAAKAKRVIYLFQSGGPSQMDLFDYKPKLKELHGQELPASVRMGQRLTNMTAGQTSFPIAASHLNFAQHGQSGAWLSELLPHTAKIADELCFIKSLQTDAINHDPAITFVLTGSERAGRPSLGSWLSYGLGTENHDLPAFVVMISLGTGRPNDQPLYDRLWGSGFLPTQHQGVKFRGSGEPVLYLTDTPGVDRALRRRMLDNLSELNKMQLAEVGDPEIATRISQYELAYRMQTSVPSLTDLSDESAETFEMYGPNSRVPGTYAANCLLARRLAERGVRFIQLFHRGWDQHRTLPAQLKGQCADTDQATAALVQDLKRRGMLDDTLIVWTGEFGRTVYCQGELKPEEYGRDHHPRCFTAWMAGGGIKPGMTLGATDELCYNIAERPVDVHDLNATILNQLGIDHTKLTFRFQGRDFRLTDVAGEVVREILS